MAELSILQRLVTETFPARAVRGALEALTLPGDVFAGRAEVPSSANNAQNLDRVSNLAGLVMGGTGLTAPANSLGAGFTLNHFGQPVRVLQNPSPRELSGFLNRTQFKAARRIVDPDTGDVFIWDAGAPALHKNIADEIGVRFDPSKSDIIGID